MRVLYWLCVSTILCVFSCSSDDEVPTPRCVPQSIHLTEYSYNDSIQYVYNSSGRLVKLIYYSGNTVSEVNQLEYNDKGALIKLLRQYPSSPGSNKAYDFIYNSVGKIEKMNHTWDPLSPPWVTSYEHDSKGRLTSVNDGFYITRYEYNDAENVTKIFYKSVHTEAEELGRINNSFDSHPRFFAHAPELLTLNVYFFMYEPSRNNVTSSTVFLPNPGTTLGQPHNLASELSYDDNGMLKSNYVPFVMQEDVKEISFKKAKYNCK
jgi:YD repeat-containing protein